MKALAMQSSLKQEGKMTNKAGKAIRCKAVAWKAGKAPVIKEVKVKVAAPQKMQARVKILYTSLYHTDAYFWEAKGQNPTFPQILGHEAGGIVESVGEGVTDLAPGDHVLPVFTGECKERAHCKSTFSEYTVVHVGCLAKINPLAPLDKVSVLSYGISTGFGATVKVAKPKKDSTVAIFGLGAVGLAAAEGARVSGASRIIGVDLNSNTYEQAKRFGVTKFVNPKKCNKPVKKVISDMTNGGVDRSVECTGSTEDMISAFECVHADSGVAVHVGFPHKDAVSKTYPMEFLEERTLKGTFFGNYKSRSDIPSVVEKYMNKELEKFITHQFPFSEIRKAFEYMLEGKSIRCIIKMEE